MDLRFELGDPESPCGHALIYFGSSQGSEVLATYAVVLPIAVNLEKYVPPAFASLIQTGDGGIAGATPMPPVAEEVESVEWLRALADARHDDLVDAGVLYSTELPNVVQMTQEAAAAYAALYNNRAPIDIGLTSQSLNGYADLTDGERLSEMTKLVGRLRDSLGTPEGDSILDELRQLAATLPSKYRSEELLEWAATPGVTGQQLATLHLQRSYRLLNEEYLEVADIERQIKELQAR